jgi:hypothetical protein
MPGCVWSGGCAEQYKPDSAQTLDTTTANYVYTGGQYPKNWGGYYTVCTSARESCQLTHSAAALLLRAPRTHFCHNFTHRLPLRFCRSAP